MRFCRLLIPFIRDYTAANIQWSKCELPPRYLGNSAWYRVLMLGSVRNVSRLLSRRCSSRRLKLFCRCRAPAHLPVVDEVEEWVACKWRGAFFNSGEEVSGRRRGINPRKASPSAPSMPLRERFLSCIITDGRRPVHHLRTDGPDDDGYVPNECLASMRWYESGRCPTPR